MVAVSAQERRFLLNQLHRLSSADVTALWAAAERLAGGDFARFIIDGFPEVVEPWMVAAADMAAVWFEESVPGPAIVADIASAERLRESASWALGADGSAARDRLIHTTQRAVYDGARDTILVNAERTGLRWARDARPDACAFCRMLATRTGRYLYKSSDTAATKTHNDCHCLPIEVPDPEGYSPPKHAQQWQDEYLKARANAGTGDTKQILSAWRQTVGVS